MTTAAASKFSALSTKLQVGTAAVAVAAAAVITPAVAHAAPSIAPFSQNVGGAASLVVDPVVILPGSNKKAAAGATANATTPSDVVSTTISGFVNSFQNGVKAVTQYFGTFVYAGLAFTGLAFNAFGLTGIGNGLINASNQVAAAIKIGPYSTAT